MIIHKDLEAVGRTMIYDLFILAFSRKDRTMETQDSR